MKTLSCLLLSAFLSLSSSAQSQTLAQAPADPQRPPLTVDVTRVPVLFNVADNKGKLITGLKKEEFRVYEDNKLQTITDFASETNLPLTVALLVDTSGSIREKLKFEQEAAIEFFYSTLKRGQDKGIVISFDSQPEALLDDFTDDPEKLTTAIRKIRAGGGTSVYDAIFLSITEKLAKQPEGSRKVIILISDGDDNSSRKSLTEALEVAQKNDIAIYAVSTNTSAFFGNSDQRRGDKTLTQLAGETGGKPYFPLKVEDLATDFQKIGEELRSQYTLVYSPTNSNLDNTFRRIRIEHPKYKVRSRSGYYAVRPVAVKVNGLR